MERGRLLGSGRRVKRERGHTRWSGCQSEVKLEHAIDVFGYGYCLGKSLHGPYVYKRVGKVALMHDDPPRRRCHRASQVVTMHTNPKETVRAIGKLDPGRHFLCVVIDGSTDLLAVRDDYRSVGYRLIGTEPLFVLDPAEANLPAGPRRAGRVSDPDRLAVFQKAIRRKAFGPDWFDGDDSLVRLYAVWSGDVPVGWVKSVKTPYDANWVSDLFVSPDFRRQGLGLDLMAAMIEDDLRFGVRQSVLLSSHTGAMLYPKLGYQRVGTLLLMSSVSR